MNAIKKKTTQKVKPQCEDECDEGCGAISFSDQCKILKEIDEEKYRNFFYFCCCTGVRVCEALSIKVVDIDRKRNVIKIKMCDSKTKKHRREIPFLPELFENFDMNNKFLFQDISDEGSKQYFYKLYQKLNLNLTRHSTRHTFVSICNYVGFEPEQVQEWVGHTNLKMTTETYTHELDGGSSLVLKYIKKLKAEFGK